MAISEAELVRRVKSKRDMTAFRDLVLAHQKRIYYLIRKIVRRHEDAEDLLQETFINILMKIDTLKDDSRFASWLSSIAVNLALGHVRKHSLKGKISIDGEMPPEAMSEKFVDSDSSAKPFNNLQGEEIQKHIDYAVASLPENHRQAFVLFHIFEMDAAGIAEIMGCPVATVHTYVFRGINQLRKKLKHYYQSYKE